MTDAPAPPARAAPLDRRAADPTKADRRQIQRDRLNDRIAPMFSAR